MTLREFLVLLLVCFIWGMHFVVMKVTISNTSPPLFYAATRMTIVAILLLPFLRIHRGQMKYVIGAGLGFGALNYAFMFPALQFVTASAAAVMIELYVPFSIILSVMFLGETVGAKRISGIVVAFVGAVIIATAKPDEAAGPYFLFGIGLMVCGAFSEAMGAFFVKKVKGVKPMELLAWCAVMGVVVLWPLTLAIESNQIDAISPDNRLNFGMALLYSSLLVSLVAHGSYYWLLQRLPLSIVAGTGLMTTLIAVAASTIILRETMSVPFIIGGVMILFGVTLILLRTKRKGVAAITPETIT
ncbi:DMT family transporter [Robiginitomaculum antarcticum]|uniref:DMT family transporter n=1 Tax=Robiginitomaculum antarcticum TaxID=437507 RepID=UPI00035E36C9|nr:DMT family transporter [Robiginitomaculum antarcticum]